MAKKNKSSLSRSSTVSWFIFAFLLIDVILLLFLYVWSFYTSFKTVPQFYRDRIWPTAPWTWSLENYVKAFDLFNILLLTETGLYRVGLIHMFINTLTYCAISVGVGITTKWAMAYVLGRFKGWHVTFIMNMFIFLMMIPIIGQTAAALKFYKAVGLYDTWWLMIWSAIPFFDYNFLILQSFIKGVGMETIESAKIDGANNWRIMWQIVFPQTFNAYLIMGLNAFIASWNNYMTSVITMPSYPSLAYGVYNFSTSTSTGTSLPPVQMAGSMLLALPVIIVFIIFKEKILGGITFAISK